MNPARWKAVQDLFWEARGLTGDERERLLAERCGGDPELLADVRSLLAAEAGTGPDVLSPELHGFTPLRAALADVTADGGNDVSPACVGPYVISEELGRGGMGIVYRAHDPRLGRDVALKFLPDWLRRDPRAEARFIAEARAASALDHPNNVTIYDVGSSEDGRRYIAIAYYPGGSLATRLAAGPLPLTKAVAIALQVASALDAAHQAGIVHRDIKPANIAFGAGDQAKVLDYGVATLGDDGGLVGGTLAYMSPEQLRGEVGDRRVDVWALGVVLYEMLTGRRPFRGPDNDTLRRAVLEVEPEPLAILRPKTPPRLAVVLTRALAKDPTDRFATAAEFAQALGEATDSRAAASSWQKGPRVARRAWPEGRVARLAAFGVLLLAGAGLALWARGLGRPSPAGAEVDQQSVAILPFRVRGAPSLAYLRDGMVDLIAAKLTGEGGLRATDPRAVYRAWRPRVAAESDDLPVDAAVALARDLGAGHVLLGDVVGDPTALVLNASVVGERGEVVGRASAQGPHEALTDLVDRLVGQLLSTSAGEESQRIASLASASLPALRAYLEGQAAYRRGLYDQAVADFGRALDHDSTFALAGLGLALAGGWLGGAESARERGHVVAWRNRQRVSERDRALLVAVVGPSYPDAPSARALLDATERALDLSPASVDLWYRLGDLFFHYGRFLSTTAWEPRAIAALRKAVAIDSTHTQALHHLLMAYGRVGDTSGLRDAAMRHLAEDSTAPSAEYVRWRAARALPSTRFRSVVLDSMSTEALTWIAISAQDDGTGIDDGHLAVALRADRPGTRNERFERLMGRYSYALNGGRPSEALSISESLRDVQPDPDFHLRLRILSALYGDGDGKAAVRAVAELERLARPGPLNACVLEQWRRLDKERDAPQASSILPTDVADPPRRSTSGATADSAMGSAGTAVTQSICAAVVEALRAAGALSSTAPASVRRLDSLLADGPVTGPVVDGHSEYAHLALSRLLERSGDRAGALTALGRRLYFLGWQPYLAVALREEGRLAESMGMPERALAVYEHYLALRENPEPELQAERERVRQDVLRLRRALVDR